MKKGEHNDAYNAYSKLTDKATTTLHRTKAQQGLMRAGHALGRKQDVVNAANSLLRAGGRDTEEENETTCILATVNAELGKEDEAMKEWKKLAKDTRNEYGARAAFDIAQHQYNKGKYSDSEKTLNAFFDSNSPQQYWLARGFILIADVYVKQGNTFEAQQYLESVKSNYPGKEADIFKMVDERLKTLKK